MASVTSIIAYDIQDDSVRAGVAALLQRHGTRVQRSVYVCVLSHEDLAELVSAISSRIDVSNDVLSVYRQCKTCWDAAEHVGQSIDAQVDASWWKVL